MREHIIRYYESRGNTVCEAIRNCKAYQDPGWSIGFKELSIHLASNDIPLAMVPFVSLADLAGVSTPIARAIIDIFGAVFEIDFWKKGLTLDKLGLADLSTEAVIKYVTQGEA